MKKTFIIINNQQCEYEKAIAYYEQAWKLEEGQKPRFTDELDGIAIIYEIMGELALQGYAIIMISSEMPEILGMCDRIVVMCEGRVAGELSREEATQERILELAMTKQTAKEGSV